MPRATDPKSHEPTVSVVIAAYNAASFIERAIRSALDQTHRVAEIIVVDDGSADTTAEVVTTVGNRHCRVKLIRLPTNAGPARARNIGFDAATGDWIAILDADDAYLPERLSHLMSRSEDADILADNLLRYHPTKGAEASPEGGKSEGWQRVDLLMFADARRQHHDFGLFQPVFRRSFLDQHGLRYPENVRHGEDFLLAFEAIARGARYLLTWHPGYLWTTRDSGWSRTAVSYEAMGAYVDALSRRDDLDLSPAVRDKLHDRAAFTEELRLHELVRDAHRSGKIFRALTLVIAHPIIWDFAVDKARGKLFGTPGSR